MVWPPPRAQKICASYHLVCATPYVVFRFIAQFEKATSFAVFIVFFLGILPYGYRSPEEIASFGFLGGHRQSPGSTSRLVCAL